MNNKSLTGIIDLGCDIYIEDNNIHNVSTYYGDTLDVTDILTDTANISGNLTTNNLRVSGTANINNLILSNITANSANITTANINNQTTIGNICVAGNITSNISTITTANITTANINNIHTTGNIVSNTSTIITANITTANISILTLSNITANYANITTANINNQTTAGNIYIAGNITTTTANITTANINNIYTTGNIVSNTSTTTTANITTANINNQTISGNLSITGNITGNVLTFNTINLTNQSITGNLSITGNISVSKNANIIGNIINGNLVVAPNKKGTSTKSNSTTFGTQEGDENYCNVTFTSNSQDGYTLSASSNAIGYQPYKAFGSSSGQWRSSNSFSKLGGGYVGSNSLTIDGVLYLGEYVQAVLPDTIYAKSSFHVVLNQVSGPSGSTATAGEIYVIGYDAGGWHMLGSHINDTDASKTINISITQRNNRYTSIGVLVDYLVITGATANFPCSLSNIYVNGFTDENDEEIYIPNCLEVGRPYTLNTTIPPYYGLVSNKVAFFNNDLTMVGSNGFLYPACICSRASVNLGAGGANITAGASALASVSAEFNHLPDGYDTTYGFLGSSYEDTNMRGKYRFPIDGYYQVNMGMRLQTADDGTRGLRPTYQNASYTSSYLIPYTDGTYWSGIDGTTTTRRCAMFSDITHAYKGHFVFPSVYSTGLVLWAYMSVSLISVD